MVSLAVIMRDEVSDSLGANAYSPKSVKRSKQDSLMDLMNRSASAFKFGNVGRSLVTQFQRSLHFVWTNRSRRKPNSAQAP
jgi:hypothetical protein